MKTAVDWLLNQIENDSDTHFHNINWDKFDELINQAKEMEKEQMIELWNMAVTCESFEQYYNETFKSNEQK
jgi:hypothetical protein